MKSLLDEVRHNPLLWLLIVVPIVLVADKAAPEAHTILFVLAVLAIVPLAALLSHATEAVAAKTGDVVGCDRLDVDQRNAIGCRPHLRGQARSRR
jgi:Ca2+:H+ antiporter